MWISFFKLEKFQKKREVLKFERQWINLIFRWRKRWKKGDKRRFMHRGKKKKGKKNLSFILYK